MKSQATLKVLCPSFPPDFSVIIDSLRDFTINFAPFQGILGLFCSKKANRTGRSLAPKTLVPPFPHTVNVVTRQGGQFVKKGNIDPTGVRGDRAEQLLARKRSFSNRALSYGEGYKNEFLRQNGFWSAYGVASLRAARRHLEYH